MEWNEEHKCPPRFKIKVCRMEVGVWDDKSDMKAPL